MSARSADNQENRGRSLDFQELVELYYADLYRFAMSLTRSETDACDLVQETFATWAAKGSQLREPGRVKAWLFTSLHRHFLMSQRHATRFPHLELESAEVELPNVTPDFTSRLDARQVLDVLAQLEPQHRAAVALFYLEDYSYAQIAAILDVPIGTVKSRLARGLARLKELVLRELPSPSKEPS